MLKLPLFILSLLLVSNCFGSEPLSDLLKKLDQTIAERTVYMDVKEERILAFKSRLQAPQLSIEQEYELNKNLSDEYSTYISDSAIHYAGNNLAIARKLNNQDWIKEANLHLASLFGISGMYMESFEILDNLEATSLNGSLKIRYYDAYKQNYKYHSYNNVYKQRYNRISDIYRDSLLMALDKTSNHYLIVYAEKLSDENRLDEAKQILLGILEKSTEINHEYAVVTHSIAKIYQKEKNTKQQNKYFAQSAIADIQNTIKENASLQLLAISLYESGDIKHAYQYINCSLEDAIFCNSHLRTVEISQLFPIIDSAYRERENKQKEQLTFYLFLTAILSILLIIAVFYVYKQMKNLSKASNEISNVNRQLKELNNQLLLSNKKLSESNTIKEEYIGHFLDLCSTYINTLENYRKVLNRKASDNKLDELFRMLRSNEMVEKELTGLYQNFDTTFLNLFPTFVEEFNALLFPEEQFVIKHGESLNVEMRIFALIRLGITDSSKIAGFLRYSSQTIYNYRSKIKSKSPFPRENFEKMIMKIGFHNK